MKLPKQCISNELLEQLRAKKVFKQGNYTFRLLDDDYIEVSQVKKYRRPDEMPEATAPWLIHQSRKKEPSRESGTTNGFA